MDKTYPPACVCGCSREVDKGVRASGQGQVRIQKAKLLLHCQEFACFSLVNSPEKEGSISVFTRPLLGSK